MYAWGINDELALGVLEKLTENENHEVDDVEDECFWPTTLATTPLSGGGLTIVQVSAGDCHSAALRQDGRVFVWGSFRVNAGKVICFVSH